MTTDESHEPFARPRKPSLQRNTIIYGVAVVVERLISFFTLPLLTKSVSVELYAVWSQFFVVAAVLTCIVMVMFTTTYVNFFAGESKSRKRAGLQGMLKVVMVNSLVVLFAAGLISEPLSLFIFGSAEYRVFVPLIAVFLWTDAVFQIVTSFLRADQRIARASVYYVLKYVGRLVVLFSVLVLADGGLVETIAAICAWQFLLNLGIYLLDLRLDPRGLLRRQLDGETWRRLWRFSLPLIPLNAAAWVGNFVDRFLLLHFEGLEAIGPYAVAWSLVSVMTVFSSVLGYTLYPNLAELRNTGQHAVVGPRAAMGITYIVFFGIPAALGITIVREPLIAVFATDAYRASAATYLMLSASLILFGVYECVSFIVLLAKDSRSILLYTLSSALLNLALNLYLIPRAGIEGAALAKLISSGVLLALAWRRATRDAPLPIPWLVVIRSLAVGLSMAVALIFLDQHLAVAASVRLFTLVAAGAGFYLLFDWCLPGSLVRRAVEGARR